MDSPSPSPAACSPDAKPSSSRRCEASSSSHWVSPVIVAQHPAPGRRQSQLHPAHKFADEGARALLCLRSISGMDEPAGRSDGRRPEDRGTHGLEAWFRSGAPWSAKPPKWKMAVATFLGVFPVAMILNLTLGPAIRSWPFVLSNAVFNACVVALLTWVVMPLVTRALHGWLHPEHT